MPDRPVAARLQEAAFALFAEQGYDATSVDQIAERAGVGRSTFFRTFPSKEAAIFPDHDEVLARIGARLAVATPGQHFLALREAARIVLRHYLDEGELARARYRLTRSVPALREREAAGMQRYQQVFRTFVRTWTPDSSDDLRDDLRAELRAELVAGAVVTAHNLVLRRWLRGITDAPEAEFETAMAEVERLFAAREAGGGGSVVVLGPGADLDEALTAVRRALS
jgi:AcrR family transcriptional regulator